MAGRGKKKISYYNVVYKWSFGVYTRRSFDDLEDYESNTIINQKSQIVEYLKNLPNVEIVDYYTDDGYTGTNFDRPGFQNMLEDIESGRINGIIVKDLSRLGRDYIGVGKYIEKIFPLYNLRIIAINDRIDSFINPESISGIMVPVKNLMNENYSSDISGKVSSAYETMAKDGKYVSGITPFGFDIDKNDKHHLVINIEEAEIVKKIFNMALSGNGKIKICKYLNDEGILCRKELQRRKKYNLSLNAFEEISIYNWSTSTVGRMLSNEVYIGNLVQLKTYKRNFKEKREIPKDKKDWIKVENTHEAIISKDDFYKVQDLIKARTPKKSPIKNTSIYKGKLKCIDCGKAMCKQDDFRGNRNVSNYYCGTFLRIKRVCSSHKIKSSVLDGLVLEAIQIQIKMVIELEKSLLKLDLLSNRTKLEEEFKRDIKYNELKIERLKKEKKQKYEDWKFNLIDKQEFLKISGEIENKIASIKDEIELYKLNYLERLKKIKKNDYWINHYKRNKKIKKVTKQVLDELVESIYVYENEKIEVNFKYKNEFESIINYLEGKEGVKLCLDGSLQYI